MTLNQSATERRSAVIVAGHRGDSDAVGTFLNDPDPHVRSAALSALRRCGVLDTAHLVTGLADPDQPVRLRATELAATHTESLNLAATLTDHSSAVVEMACWTCGERPDGVQWLPRLVTIAQTHDDPLCREAAVAALGAIGDPQGLPAILSACEDKPAIRRRAVLALTPFEGDSDPDPVRLAWTGALEDRDWQVRQAAEDLLGHNR